MRKALEKRNAAASSGEEAEAATNDVGQHQASARVLAIALVLSLWVAFGNLILAIFEGLGEDPARRLIIGLFFVLGIAGALWQRVRVCSALQARPWLVILVAAAQVAAIAADGALASPYKAVGATSVGVAAIVARPSTVWSCVAVLDIGLAAGILVQQSPSALMESGQLGDALGALFGYPFVAVVVLGLATLFLRFVSRADAIIDGLRGGSPALTPALTQAIQLDAVRPVRLLAPPSPFAHLTAREIEAVEALAVGRRPKQIAFEWGIALATVRKHLRRAKQKTGARTLAQLAAMTKSGEWPSSTRDT